MVMDVLADVLRALRLRGTVYFRADFREPWGLEIRGGEFANFHIVAQGQCWLRTGESPTLQALEPGDVVIFPRGDPHALLQAPGAEAVPASTLISGDATAGDDAEGRVFGGPGPVTTTLICGHFEYDRRYPHPLFETLPVIVHVRASEHGNADWLATAGRLVAAESAASRPGAGAVVDRLAEALLIQALLGHLDSMSQPEANSFLAAIQDRCIGHALALIHRELARDWTLDELARAAGVSRSVFTERFRALIGESPMVYIARWRLLKARELLLDTSLSVAQVADLVGYQSEFSFGKAFKRLFGMPPGAARSTA
jgi:AraC-like DNA-binding protein